MAPSNAPGLTLPARKKLVVPALPILPGVARAKPSTSTVNGQNREQVNGSTSRHSPAPVRAQETVQTEAETNHRPAPSLSERASPINGEPGLAGHGFNDQSANIAGVAVQASHTVVEAPNGSSAPKAPGSAPPNGTSATEIETRGLGLGRMQLSESTAPAITNGQGQRTVTPLADDKLTVFDGVSPLSQHDHGSAELSAHTTPNVSNVDVTSPYHSRPEHRRSGLVERHHHMSNASESSTTNTNGFHTPAGTAYSEAEMFAYATAPFPTIQEYLLHLANAKQYGADWAIQIEQPTGNSPPSTFYAHGLLLYRSERLRNVMSSSHDPNYLPQINLYPARAIQPHAFDAALRFFYTDTVLGSAAFPKDSFGNKQARLHIVDYILSYWAAGIELGIGPVAMRAFDLLADAADWDVAEFLVKEVADLRKVSLQRRATNVQPGALFVAHSIVGIITKLFSTRLDLAGFRLDTTSHPTLLQTRFAAFETGRASDNPVLASIAFGSMPSSASLSPSTPTFADAMPNPIETTASIILLNLDFEDLKVLTHELIQAHGEDGKRVIVDVVAEREKRRAAIVQSKAVSSTAQANHSTKWDVLDVHEFVVNGELQRERIDPRKSHKATAQ